MQLTTFENDGLTFDVTDTGGDGDVIILLHGFPETKESWSAVTPPLSGAGLRVMAPDQRGYSPNARPPGRRSYTMDKIAGDAVALADAAGADRFHVVGHDWGGAVAWALAAGHPARIASATSLATPHPRAMAKAMLSSSQILRSWYVLAFQIPELPERMLSSALGGQRFKRRLVESGLSEHRADSYLRMMQTGGAGPAINWYRAVPFGGRAVPPKVQVPVLYIYGGKDFALTRRAADLTGDEVEGPYRYEVLEDMGHWLPDAAPGVVASLVLEHVRAHPA